MENTSLFPLKKGRTRMGMIDILVNSNGSSKGALVGEAFADEVIKRVNNWDKLIEFIELFSEESVYTYNGDNTYFHNKARTILNELDK